MAGLSVAGVYHSECLPTEAFGYIVEEIERAIGEYVGNDYYEATVIQVQGRGTCGYSVGLGCGQPTYSEVFCYSTVRPHRCEITAKWNEPLIVYPFPPGGVLVCDESDHKFYADLAHTDCDRDGDGWISPMYDVGDDCDDGNPNIHPFATERCNDNVDSDCDGWDNNDCQPTSCPLDYCYPPLESDCQPADPCMYPDNEGCPTGRWRSGGCCCYWCPLLLDLAGNGFDLTDAQNGVQFDFYGNSQRSLTGWTSGGSDDAFLVLDLNGNGVVDSGRELFGNISPQPPSNERNGFRALAEYDRPERGGNANGTIDVEDAIFARLRLWQDVNHNGISETTEIHNLESLGLSGISLSYKESKQSDQYGNLFRYRSKVDAERDSGISKWAWDVIFTNH